MFCVVTVTKNFAKLPRKYQQLMSVLLVKVGSVPLNA